MLNKRSSVQVARRAEEKCFCSAKQNKSTVWRKHCSQGDLTWRRCCATHDIHTDCNAPHIAAQFNCSCLAFKVFSYRTTNTRTHKHKQCKMHANPAVPLLHLGYLSHLQHLQPVVGDLPAAAQAQAAQVPQPTQRCHAVVGDAVAVVQRQALQAAHAANAAQAPVGYPGLVGIIAQREAPQPYG
jgi:hypothetical protein